MKSPKIAFYCSSLSWGGLEMNVYDRMLWLENEGYQCVLFCVSGSRLHKKALADNKDFVLVKRNHKSAALNSALRLKKLFKSYKISACFISDNRDMAIMGLVKRLGFSFKVLFLQAMQLGIAKRDFIHTLRFRAIDLWISPLNYLKEQVAEKTRFPIDKVRVLPLGVKPEKLEYKGNQQEARREMNLPEDAIILGIIGRIDPLKRQDWLVRALSSLDTKVQVLIMGESTLNEGNSYEASIKQLISENKLEERVHFRAFDPNIAVFFKASDVFVLASKAETYGMVTVEALMSACVVVASDKSGSPELLENGKLGLLYASEDHKHFTETLVKVIGDLQHFKERAVENAPYCREKYDADKESRELANILEEIL